ncbi:hypothetical protein [Clostridium culturomicium]|uniref:hypothetical protein n=1 Tax=Clostridium culturomicium TaxID=1499683 RepID=UPI00059121D9|nr:hypothetical protein [Clostridium culturomicium]
MNEVNVNVGDVLWVIRTRLVGKDEYYYTEPICVDELDEDYIIVHEGCEEEFEGFYPVYYELDKECFKLRTDAENKIMQMYKEDYNKDRVWYVEISSLNENEKTAWISDTGKILSRINENEVLIASDYWADEIPPFKGTLGEDTFLNLEEAQQKAAEYNKTFKWQGFSIDESFFEWQVC